MSREYRALQEEVDASGYQKKIKRSVGVRTLYYIRHLQRRLRYCESKLSNLNQAEYQLNVINVYLDGFGVGLKDASTLDRIDHLVTVLSAPNERNTRTTPTIN